MGCRALLCKSILSQLLLASSFPSGLLAFRKNKFLKNSTVMEKRANPWFCLLLGQSFGVRCPEPGGLGAQMASVGPEKGDWLCSVQAGSSEDLTLCLYEGKALLQSILKKTLISY